MEELPDVRTRYVDSCVKMSFTEWQDEFLKLKRKHRNDLIVLITKKRLENKGYVDLGPFSFLRWIENEWFEKAKAEGVIETRSKWVTKHDGEKEFVTDWVAVSEEREEKIEVGKRGAKPIYETVKSLDFSKFQNFMKRYEEWKQQQKKTYIGHEDLEDIKSLFN